MANTLATTFAEGRGRVLSARRLALTERPLCGQGLPAHPRHLLDRPQPRAARDPALCKRGHSTQNRRTITGRNLA